MINDVQQLLQCGHVGCWTGVVGSKSCVDKDPSPSGTE